jgi:hypothetical protein
LAALPGYVSATNAARRDAGGATVTVHLEPGGLVRMNFGVQAAAPKATP